MPITESSREKINWLVFESVLIVISILLAFWIDAWWDEKQLEFEEREVLTSLLDDFRDKRALIEVQRGYMDAILNSIKKLLYSSSDTPTLSNSSVDRLLGDIWWNNESSIWSAPLLDSVVTGGDLKIISNRQLRIELIAWSERFSQIEELVVREVDFYDERFMPFMESNIEMRQILNAIEHAPGNPAFKYEYGEKFRIEVPTDHSDLLINREFQAILVRRSILLNDILIRLSQDLEKDLDAAILSIEAEVTK